MKAEVLFAEKGTSNTKISDIAQSVGVADSLLYQYFKGKEDLLFTIIRERLVEYTMILNQHLQGIRSAESRLEKMIWFHLWNQDIHPDYTKLLFFECRFNKKFYQSEAYKVNREYAILSKSILADGIEEGAFKRDLNLGVARDIIFGTLDTTTINCIILQETERLLDDFEDIIRSIFTMIKSDQEYRDQTSDKILKAAELVFSEQGYNQAKISDIARAAGVSDGAVYDYHESKEQLLMDIARIRFEKCPINRQRAINDRNEMLKKVRGYIWQFYMLFLANDEFYKVFIINIQLNKEFYKTPAFEHFRACYQCIEDLIDEGKTKKIFRTDISTRVLRNVFLGSFFHLCLRRYLLGPKLESKLIIELIELEELFISLLLEQNESNA